MNELALFAGAGGGILGGHLLGWRTVCAVEWEPYAASVLAARQNEGFLPAFPIWDDVQTFDGRPWRGIVDVVSGGFPCQDISVAGKGAGIDGERSGMWRHMARIVGEVRPSFVYVENSPAIITRGLGRVLGDLAALGYDCRWTVLGAADVGAPHQRDRFWLVAHANLYGGKHVRGKQLDGTEISESCFCGDVLENANGKGLEGAHQQPGKQGLRGNTSGSSKKVADAASERQPRQRQSWFGSDPAEKGQGEADHAFAERIGYVWGIESPVGRVANGVAARVDRLKAIGNGQVPSVAATAWKLLTEDSLGLF